MFTNADLSVKPEDKQLAYHKRKQKKGVFWGQRKLLIGEIYFLTEYYLKESCSREPIVIYAGAAPGSHIELIKILFPKLELELYDPRNFQVKSDSRTRIHCEFFTDISAYYWSQQDRPILFISDIRSADWRSLTEEETEQEIMADMRAQERWVSTMNPVSSYLKFRLPWSGKGQNLQVNYLDGIIVKQSWARLSSTETRLIPNEKQTVWDALKYEEQLFHHNSVIRENAFYPEGNIDPPNLNGSYDSTAEVFILQNYLTASKSSQSVVELSKWISQQLGGTINSHYKSH